MPQGFGSGQAACLFLMSNRPFSIVKPHFQLEMELNVDDIARYFKIIAKMQKCIQESFFFLADEDLSLETACFIPDASTPLIYVHASYRQRRNISERSNVVCLRVRGL